jgi:hypothetical protein
VADGAPWIVPQVEERFGNQAKFLVDFYHVSEYLSAASESLGKNKKALWLKRQQRSIESKSNKRSDKGSKKAGGDRENKAGECNEKIFDNQKNNRLAPAGDTWRTGLLIWTTNNVEGRATPSVPARLKAGIDGGSK